MYTEHQQPLLNALTLQVKLASLDAKKASEV